MPARYFLFVNRNFTKVSLHDVYLKFCKDQSGHPADAAVPDLIRASLAPNKGLLVNEPRNTRRQKDRRGTPS
jgi:hypothetical protein